ncbi:histidinol-phosphatase [Roseibium sp.]|uniref:histidinol-phosphatase n=1 Tax=Roseibium sp. TaxID=1936156 RepID=UPI003A9876FD
MASSHPLVPFLDTLSAAAAKAILPHFRGGLDVENKLASGFDPVTIADKAAETAMRAEINKTYPGHGILGEEHGSENLDAEYVWVLDPIDGTRAFISGLPTWGVLIGLKTNGKPDIGMMGQPYIGEAFVGDCKSAWYEGPIGSRPLKTRPCDSIENAILLTTAPEMFKGAEAGAYNAIEAQTRLVRYSTDCYGYAMIAAGQVDCVIETGLQAYDIVALIPVIEGAGGVITNWTGGPATDGGQVVASGDPRLHEKLLAKLASGAV